MSARDQFPHPARENPEKPSVLRKVPNEYTTDPAYSPIIEQFKVGQTVWHKEAQEVRLLVIGQSGDDLWLRDNNFRETAHRYDSRMFTTTDPNQTAELVPQNCPFCGSATVSIQEFGTRERTGASWKAECDSCLMNGPCLATRIEAIQAWNRISLRDES